MTSSVFYEFLSSIGPEISLSGEDSFDLLFEEDDIATTTYLTHDGSRIATDIIVVDLSGMHVVRRQALMQHIFIVNNIMARKGNYRLSVDYRKLLVLTGEFNIREYPYDYFQSYLMSWVKQVKELRKLVDAFTHQH